MLFATGIIIMALTAAAIVVYMGVRKGKLPAHGTRAALAMCALVLGFLVGGGCVFASLLMLAARWLP